MNWFKDVYLINAKQASIALRDGSITEYQALKHLITTTVLVGANVSVPITFTMESEFSFSAFYVENLMYFLILAAVSYYGLLMCYQANSKGDGREFFVRLVTLGLPVMIRVAVFSALVFILLTMLLSLLLGNLGGISMPTFNSYQFLFIVAVNMSYFITLRKYVANSAGYTQ